MQPVDHVGQLRSQVIQLVRIVGQIEQINPILVAFVAGFDVHQLVAPGQKSTCRAPLPVVELEDQLPLRGARSLGLAQERQK